MSRATDRELMVRKVSHHCKETAKRLRTGSSASKARNGKTLTTHCKNKANDWRKKGNYVDKTQPRNKEKGLGKGRWKPVRKSTRSSRGKHSGRPRNR